MTSGNGSRPATALARRTIDGLAALRERCAAQDVECLVAACVALVHRCTAQSQLLVRVATAELQALGSAATATQEARPPVALIDLSDDPTIEDVIARTIATLRRFLEPGSATADDPWRRSTRAESEPDSRGALLLLDFSARSVKATAAGKPREFDDASANTKMEFDVRFLLSFSDAGWTVRVEDLRDGWSGIAPEELQALFEAVLCHMPGNPATRVSLLPLASEAVRKKVVVEWNRTESDYPSDRPLHQLVEARAAKTPQAVAVAFQGRSLSYRDLDSKANELAMTLARRGIGRGDFVGVLMDRSFEQPLCLLAIMKTGAAFIPLDTGWPVERIAGIVRDSGSKLLLVEKERASESAFGVACIAVDASALAGAAARPELEVSPDDPLYVIYTSGSTGKPKGVVNRHRGIVNRMTHLTRHYGFGETDAFLQTTAFIFDSSVEQLFCPLINGGKTVVPPPMLGYEIRKILDVIEHEAVTFTDFVSSFFTVLVGDLSENEADRRRFRTVRQVLIGGEAANPKALHRFKEIFPYVRLTNNYGPTETSIAVIEYEVNARFVDPVPIGKPIANTHAFILDSAFNPLPPGIPGDLYIGGVCVGLGYLNDTDKTRAAFLPHPLPEFAGERIYRTGDKARFLADGNIEFFGRDDQQVKVHGVRVELWEIEAALGKHPAVLDVVAMAREDVVGDRRLVAYFTASKMPVPDAGELRTFLAQTLPQGMIPAAFVYMESLPLTQNGKIDRGALPAPMHRVDVVPDGERPATPMELLLCDAWRKVLGIEQIGCADNFFDLGGSSLLAAQVIASVEGRTGVRLDPQEMAFQTLGQLAAYCETRLVAPPGGAPGLLRRLVTGARRLVGTVRLS